jgi:PPP family 3-phenylpropionic acid transporter
MTAFAGAVGFCGIFLADSFYVILIIMMVMSIFTCSTMPLAESLTLSHLSSHKGNKSYSHVRLWGSIGFICAAFSLGFIIDFTNINAVVWALLVTQVLVFIFVKSMINPNENAAHINPIEPHNLT